MNQTHGRIPAELMLEHRRAAIYFGNGALSK